jgi:hypothetical protein
MTKLQSSVDVAMEMLRELEEFKQSGSKEAFGKQLRQEFVRRSGAATLDEALATAITSLVSLLRQTERAIAETHWQIAQTKKIPLTWPGDVSAAAQSGRPSRRRGSEESRRTNLLRV